MKRHLNKIILINSASVPYGEIELDGNIHFVGSNGFGKTTVLRSILFFYNPSTEKRALGIREDQKSFSAYYFGEEASYILYEINTEPNPITAICYKKGGKLHFRFIDAPYDKKYFLTDYKANSQEQIWKRLEEEGVYFSDEIQRHADFRNVIYGSTGNKALKRFSIFQTKQGMRKKRTANIPQLISNIFRTSKLDSRHLKKSIIDAVFEEDIRPMDLSTVERQLAKFKNDHKDLEAFENNEKTASEIVDMHDRITELDEQMKQEAEKLGNAVRNVGEKLKRLAEDTQVHKALLEKEESRFQEIDSQFSEKRDALNADIAVIRRDLQEIENLKAQYQGRNIDEAIKRVENKQLLEKELERLQSDIKDSTAGLEDVQQLYKNKLERLQIEARQVEQDFAQRKQKIREEFSEKADQLKKDFAQKKEQVRLASAEDQEILDEQKEMLREEVARLKYQIRSVEEASAKDGRLGSMQAKMQAEKQKQRQCEREAQFKQQEVKAKEQAYSLSLQNLNQRLDAEERELSEKMQRLESELQAIVHKQESYGGSLLEFLSKSGKEWKSTVGKVIQPDLLYQKDLSPEWTEESSTLFGLQLQLSSLEVKEDVLADLDEQKLVLAETLEKQKHRLAELQFSREAQVVELKSEFQEPIMQWRKEIEQLQYEQSQAETHWKSLSLELEKLEHQVGKEKASEISRFQADLEKAEEQLRLVQSKWQGLTLMKASEVQQVETQLQEKLKEQDAVRKEKETVLLEEQQLLLGNLKKEEQNLKAEKDDLLAGKGFDSSRLKEKESRIAEIQGELRLIRDDSEKLVEQYYYNKERLFDKEDGFQEQKVNLEAELAKEKQRFEEQTLQVREGIENLKEKLFRLHHEQNDWEVTLQNDFEQFKLSGLGLFEKLQGRIENPSEEMPEETDVKGAIHLINSHYNHLNVNLATMQKRIHKFTGLFSQGNFLNFPTSKQFDSDGDYNRFVRKRLKPFLENQSIKQAREQLEKMHAELVSDIAGEIKDFSSKTSEISATIRQINKDFQSTNFVGVVKSIALDYRENNLGIVNILKKIKTFAEDNNFSAQADFFKSNRTQAIDRQSVNLLNRLKNAIDNEKKKTVSVEDTFDLWFRIEENNNDTGWVEKLTNVGSEGTDVLVKAMIYITLLNVFKENAFKVDDGYLIHCMIDEVGKLSDRYLRELIEFTNNKNIRLIFGSPNENDPLIYQHVYKLHRQQDAIRVVELVGEAS
ncbi:MAG: ATP-binding protein [Cytophagales bacterium]|nr:ATP-binding protein [Cytophagales bacterium]